jgi:hypothetical protein
MKYRKFNMNRFSMSAIARFTSAILCFALGTACALADDETDGRNAGIAAAKFINDYCATTFADQRQVIAWVDKRQDVFPIYKDRLSKLYLDALKQDPEVGYGADAILSTVEDGGSKYRVVDTFFGRAHITLTLQATAPADCKHQVRVVMMQDEDGKWKVRSSGDLPF